MSRKFTATVKESESGRSYIAIEANVPNGLLDDQTITIDFIDGTPIEKVSEFARSLNHGVDAVENIRVVKW